MRKTSESLRIAVESASADGLAVAELSIDVLQASWGWGSVPASRTTEASTISAPRPSIASYSSSSMSIFSSQEL